MDTRQVTYLYAANYAVYSQLLQRCGVRNPRLYSIAIG